MSKSKTPQPEARAARVSRAKRRGSRRSDLVFMLPSIEEISRLLLDARGGGSARGGHRRGGGGRLHRRAFVKLGRVADDDLIAGRQPLQKDAVAIAIGDGDRL